MVATEMYEAPADGNSNIAFDPFKEKDAELTRETIWWLNKTFPQYPWGAISDIAQGIVRFNIPILMGFENYYVINLSTTEAFVDDLLKGADEILRRYALTSKFNVGAFLEAREKHSKLVVSKREIPG